MTFSSWLTVRDAGLYCIPGDFYIDPARPVDRAIVTHGHSDHARPGHARVLATEETLAIMRLRLRDGAGLTQQTLPYGETLRMGEVAVRLEPAGHVLGSAQVAIDHRGRRAVISGDYKRASDPTCAPFELTPCDLFVTEATFALPVFTHEPAPSEIRKLLASVARNPERAHLVGAYGLGKSQRVIRTLRDEGWDRPIYLHGAVAGCCALYEERGSRLGELRSVAGVPKGALKGEIVMAPPSALADRWSRRLPDPVAAFASGWMRVRARARQKGVELPLVISDHADWGELVSTIRETGAEEVWVTHGREEALIHHLAQLDIAARALALIGREDEDE
jgi:putative mRNA 3-end processing factor